MKMPHARVAPVFSSTLVAAVLIAADPAIAAQAIPPPPAEGRLIADYADLLSFVGEATVEGSQQKALREHDTPIVVVTIRRMADYDVRASGIEEFARTWFDRWGIGTVNNRGGSNKGILLLVSERDRKARIELGGDWGRAWDRQARKIMDESIVPKLRAGSFDDGIDRGVAALAEMAATGPSGQAPTVEWSDRFQDSAPFRSVHGLLQRASAFSMFGPLPFSLVLLLGLGMIGASFRSAKKPRDLLVGGLTLVVLAIFSASETALWATLAGGALARFVGFTDDDDYSRRRRRDSRWGGSSSWSSSSSSSSGSGFGGGSSGGGGATGSW